MNRHFKTAANLVAAIFILTQIGYCYEGVTGTASDSTQTDWEQTRVDWQDPSLMGHDVQAVEPAAEEEPAALQAEETGQTEETALETEESEAAGTEADQTSAAEADIASSGYEESEELTDTEIAKITEILGIEPASKEITDQVSGNGYSSVSVKYYDTDGNFIGMKRVYTYTDNEGNKRSMASYTNESGELVKAEEITDEEDPTIPVSSEADKYGDVTYFNAQGQKLYTTHTTQDYDDEGNPIEGTQETTIIKKYNYNEDGQLESVENKVGEEEWQIDTYSYDDEGNLISITNETTGDVTHFDTEDPDHTWVTSGVNGNIISETQRDEESGLLTTTYYDEASGTITGTATYDENDNMIACYDMDGNLTMSFFYDDEGRLTHTESFIRDESGEVVLKNVTTYDEWGNKIMTVQEEVIPKGGLTPDEKEKVKDIFGVEPDSKDITDSGSGDGYSWETTKYYDEDGELIGTKLEYTYEDGDGKERKSIVWTDKDGEIVKVEGEDPEDPDDPTDPVSSETNQYGDVTYFNTEGQKLYTTHTTQDYDEEGNPIEGTQETHVVMKYNYDDEGRLSSVEKKVGEDEWQTSTYAYDEDGELLTITNETTGNVTHFEDDGSSYTTSGVNGNIINKTYTDEDTGLLVTEYYDEASGDYIGKALHNESGQLEKLFDMDGNLTMQYFYDDEDRVTSSEAYIRNEDGDVVLKNVTTYDEFGNMMMTTQEVVEPDDRDAYDPWTMGELAMIDGHLAILVDPADVNGKNFYNFDPSEMTGETKMTEDGRYIFMLGIDDDGTEAELMELIGEEVNVMWQYYTESDDAAGYGWIWLAPTDDGRVNHHLNNDDAAKVEQHGGEWDRSKQYVVVSQEGEAEQEQEQGNQQNQNQNQNRQSSQNKALLDIVEVSLGNLSADAFVVSALGHAPVEADAANFIDIGCENMLQVHDALTSIAAENIAADTAIMDFLATAENMAGIDDIMEIVEEAGLENMFELKSSLDIY